MKRMRRKICVFNTAQKTNKCCTKVPMQPKKQTSAVPNCCAEEKKEAGDKKQLLLTKETAETKLLKNCLYCSLGKKNIHHGGVEH